MCVFTEILVYCREIRGSETFRLILSETKIESSQKQYNNFPFNRLPARAEKIRRSKAWFRERSEWGEPVLRLKMFMLIGKIGKKFVTFMFSTRISRHFIKLGAWHTGTPKLGDACYVFACWRPWHYFMTICFSLMWCRLSELFRCSCFFWTKKRPSRKLAGVSGRQTFHSFILFLCFSCFLQPVLHMILPASIWSHWSSRPGNSLFSDLVFSVWKSYSFDSLTGLIHRRKCRVPQIQVHPDWRRWVCCGVYGATLCRVPSGQHSFYSSKTEADPWTEVWRNQIWVPETRPQRFWKNNR